jgi:hypothetical protein
VLINAERLVGKMWLYFRESKEERACISVSILGNRLHRFTVIFAYESL